MAQQKLSVLFLCTGNSARSQMAEALLRHHGSKRFDAFSAGTHPEGVDPRTLETLQAAGISSAGLTSKAVETYTDQHFDFVIALCDNAHQRCPYWPGSGHVLDWGFSDPKADPNPGGFARTLNAIEQRIRMFIEVNSKVRPLYSPLTATLFYKSLADELRLKMLLLIERHTELCVCDLTDALNESQPKVSRHLAQLRKSGVLSDRRQGQWVYYRLHPAMPAWMREVLSLTASANGMLIEDCLRNMTFQACNGEPTCHDADAADVGS